jgi:hypothetical protein
MAMRHLLPILVIAACSRGSKDREATDREATDREAKDREATDREATGPQATGKLVFDVRPAAEADVHLATEAAVLRSDSVLQRLREQHQTTVDAAAIRVRRDPDTMILAVTVHDPDPAVAARTCNQLLHGYIEQRMGMAIMAVDQQLQVLAQNLEKSPDDVDLQKRIKDLELERQLRRIDVRVLDPCKAR